MHERGIDVDDATVVFYSSPFQRCIDTAIGVARGMQQTAKTAALRLELGLGEWMCERFFDQICPAAQLTSRQQVALAKQQVSSFNNKGSSSGSGLPFAVDYGYKQARTEFVFPERYSDMLKRFDETRMHCCAVTTAKLPVAAIRKHIVVVMVTHAIGISALLDSFRHTLTRPVETSYCSISCVTRCNNMAVFLPSPTSENGPDDDDTANQDFTSINQDDGSDMDRWQVELQAFDAHLSWSPALLLLS